LGRHGVRGGRQQTPKGKLGYKEKTKKKKKPKKKKTKQVFTRGCCNENEAIPSFKGTKRKNSRPGKWSIPWPGGDGRSKKGSRPEKERTKTGPEKKRFGNGS